MPTRASVELGPVISMLPISKRRSEIEGEGCWILVSLRISFQIRRKDEGCVRRKIWRFGFFLGEASAVRLSSGEDMLVHHMISTVLSHLFSLSRSRIQPCHERIPVLHLAPFLPPSMSSSTPISLSRPSKLVSTPSIEIVLI